MTTRQATAPLAARRPQKKPKLLASQLPLAVDIEIVLAFRSKGRLSDWAMSELAAHSAARLRLKLNEQITDGEKSAHPIVQYVEQLLDNPEIKRPSAFAGRGNSMVAYGNRIHLVGAVCGFRAWEIKGFRVYELAAAYMKEFGEDLTAETVEKNFKKWRKHYEPDASVMPVWMDLVEPMVDPKIKNALQERRPHRVPK